MKQADYDVTQNKSREDRAVLLCLPNAGHLPLHPNQKPKRGRRPKRISTIDELHERRNKKLEWEHEQDRRVRELRDIEELGQAYIQASPDDRERIYLTAAMAADKNDAEGWWFDSADGGTVRANELRLEWAGILTNEEEKLVTDFRRLSTQYKDMIRTAFSVTNKMDAEARRKWPC